MLQLSMEILRVLLNYKVDANARSDEGWTPMHYVSQRSQSPGILNIHQSLPDVSRLLLGHGADMNARISYSDRCGTGRTPLHVTMEFNRDEVVRVMLEHGANVDAEDGAEPLSRLRRRKDTTGL